MRYGAAVAADANSANERVFPSSAVAAVVEVPLRDRAYEPAIPPGVGGFGSNFSTEAGTDRASATYAAKGSVR
jgi:hypothetical protein